MGKWNVKRSLVLPQEAAEYILRNLAFFGFLASLVVVYIYIVHNGQGKVRQYQTLRKEVRELRWDYLTRRSELMVASQQSSLARDMILLHSGGAGSIPVILKKS